MNKTIFITGSSTGIGKAIALYFAEKQWNVAATMRNPANEKELTKFPNVKLYQLDVTNTQSIDNAIEQSIKDFGKIDVLVNNAGYGLDGVFEAMNDEMIKTQFGTNVFGLMRVTRAIIPHFRKNKAGTIIQIASVGGRATFPLFSIYHSTKFAVEGFSESLQYELKPFNIKVKIIEPGAIKTDFYGRSRVNADLKGLTEYETYAKNIEKVSQKFGEKGVAPIVVAKKVYKAATTKCWKLRYPIGYPAPLLVFIKRFIPDTWYYAMVNNMMK